MEGEWGLGKTPAALLAETTRELQQTIREASAAFQSGGTSASAAGSIITAASTAGSRAIEQRPESQVGRAGQPQPSSCSGVAHASAPIGPAAAAPQRRRHRLPEGSRQHASAAASSSKPPKLAVVAEQLPQQPAAGGMAEARRRMAAALLLMSALITALHTRPQWVPDIVKHAGGWRLSCLACSVQ